MSATTRESNGRATQHDAHDGGWQGFIEASRTMCDLAGVGLYLVHLSEMPPRAVVVVESRVGPSQHARDSVAVSSPDAHSLDVDAALAGLDPGWQTVTWDASVALLIQVAGAKTAPIIAWMGRELSRFHDFSRVEAVLDAIGEGVIIVGADRRIKHCTTRAAELLGVADPTTIEGRIAREIMPHAIDELEPSEVARGTVADDHAVAFVAHHLAPRVGDTEPRPGIVLRLRSEARFSETRRGQMRLLATLRHDVRSPLTALRGLVSVLQEEPDIPREERLSLLELLRQEAERTVTWVEDYLLLLRLRFEPRPVSPVTISPEDAVRALEHVLTPHARERGITFSIDSALRPGVSFLAEQGLLDAFCKNLVGHFMRLADSGATISLRIDADGTLRVEGFGPGLFAQHPDEPFTTLARSTAAGKRTPGIGLGLFLAKKVADVHGWPIAIESSEGVVRATVRWTGRAAEADLG